MLELSQTIVGRVTARTRPTQSLNMYLYSICVTIAREPIKGGGIVGDYCSVGTAKTQHHVGRRSNDDYICARPTPTVLTGQKTPIECVGRFRNPAAMPLLISRSSWPCDDVTTPSTAAMTRRALSRARSKPQRHALPVDICLG